MANGYNHFTDEEREELYMLVTQGCSKSDIALMLGKHRSTIYKELARNSNAGRYSPTKAAEFYKLRRVKSTKLESDSDLRNQVIALLKRKYSPGQIVLHFKKINGESPISAESIYTFVYSDLGKELGLPDYLRRKRKRRKPRKSTKVKKSPIPCRTPISERSDRINDRNEFGHWEGDLMIFSKQQETLITLRERKTRVILAIKNSGKESIETANKIIKTFSGINKIYFESCTLDNGGEFSKHQMIAKKLKAETYFCDPYASYQKGSIEQGNGMIRVELPRSTDLSMMTQSEINRIIKNINNRPMALHNGRTPSELFRDLTKNNVKGVVALQT